MTTANLKKGDTIRTVRPCKSYMQGANSKVIGYQDVEILMFVIESVFTKRNKIKVKPHAESPGIAYGCIISLDRFPGTIEKLV